MEFHALSKEKAFMATALYADIFSYPLTRLEIRQWSLLYPISRCTLPKTLEEYKGFIICRGHKSIVGERLAKAVWQEEKWRIAQRASRWLGYIPTMKLIGVTGGLAMNNAAGDDDIDLFCVVASDTLWISRFLATILMDMLGLRRHPADERVANKVCLNMFMTEDGVDVPPAEQDCFSAHEVLQMQPLWQQKGTYKKFLLANTWVRTFLPNAWKEKMNQESGIRNQEKFFSKTIIHDSSFIILKILEPLARIFQLSYMRRHRTHEVITDTILRFHPKDARVWIKRKLSLRLKKYNIPLDKVFWAN